LIFEGNDSGSYTITFGGGDTIGAPVYDIERYRREILETELDRLWIGGVEFVSVEVNEQYDYTWMFNVVVVVVAVVLGLLIVLKLRKKS